MINIIVSISLEISRNGRDSQGVIERNF